MVNKLSQNPYDQQPTDGQFATSSELIADYNHTPETDVTTLEHAVSPELSDKEAIAHIALDGTEVTARRAQFMHDQTTTS